MVVTTLIPAERRRLLSLAVDYKVRGGGVLVAWLERKRESAGEKKRLSDGRCPLRGVTVRVVGGGGSGVKQLHASMVGGWHGSVQRRGGGGGSGV
jgi:hypothetical protein